jgi:uncharacterized protein (DUF302 family)
MDYTFETTLEGSFSQVRERVIEALKVEKFGVITTIDVQQTVKTKIDKDMPAYEILGACNPGHAYNAIMAEEHIGAFLPCNVVLSEQEDKKVKVILINPMSMQAMIPSPEISKIMTEVEASLKRVVESL